MSFIRRLFGAGLRDEWPEVISTIEHAERSAQLHEHHDLLADTVILSCELPDALNDTYDRYVQDFNPQYYWEYDLIDELAAACLRLRRIWALEINMIEDQMSYQNSDHDMTCISGAMTNLAAMPKYSLLCRQESHVSRTYQRALRTLLASRSPRFVP